MEKKKKKKKKKTPYGAKPMPKQKTISNSNSGLFCPLLGPPGFCCGSYLFIIFIVLRVAHNFVATLRLSALPSALYFVLSKLAM